MRGIAFIFSMLIGLVCTGQVRNEIDVTFNKNSYLFFPGDVNFVDVGSDDVMVQFEGNMVVISSFERDHEETSLFVTSDNDGRFFFLVSYADEPEQFIHNYEGMGVKKEVLEVEKVKPMNQDSLYIFNQFNKVDYEARVGIMNSIDIIAGDDTRVFDIGIAKKKLMFKARGVYYDGDFIYLSLELVNYSDIDYEMDFVKFFMVNTKGAAKKTFQEDELLPVVRYHPYTVARSDGGINVIYGFKKFTMTNKKLQVDIWEHRGDRRLEITVGEGDILKAQRVQELN